MKDFKEGFLENISKIQLQFDESNFIGCRRLSSELIAASNFFDFVDGVLIAEILESIFDNLNELNDRYEIEKEDLAELNKLITNIIKMINNSNLNFNDKNKIKIYDLLKDFRVKATRMQVNYHMVKKLKKEESGVLPFPPDALKFVSRVS